MTRVSAGFAAFCGYLWNGTAGTPSPRLRGEGRREGELKRTPAQGMSAEEAFPRDFLVGFSVEADANGRMGRWITPRLRLPGFGRDIRVKALTCSGHSLSRQFPRWLT